jgi:Flp pilus assembly protein TadG
MPRFHVKPGCSPAADLRGGQAIVLAALTMTVLFSAMGLAMDLGWGYFLKTRVQTAADAGATAAAVYASHNADTCSTVTCGVAYTCAGTTPPTTSLQAGCLYATVDGPPVLTATMIENNAAHPPAGLSGNTPTMWVKATVTASNSNHFLFLQGFHTASILASSIAGVYSGGGGGCVYVLNPTAANAWLQSGGTFTTGCGVYVNSNSAQAYVQSGGIDTFNGGSSLYIVGSENKVGGITAFNGGGSAKTSQASFSNPVSGLTGPNPGSPCTADPNISGGNSNPIASGTYCSLTISGGNGIVFSGTYIISSGNFSISGGNFSTGPGGATIYLPASNSTGTVQISGGNGTFAAPTSGSLAGFSLWQNNSVAANVSGANVTFNGIIYMPSAALTYSGSNTAATMSIVVNKITMSGGNISQPATSGFFANGASFSGGTLIQ